MGRAVEWGPERADRAACGQTHAQGESQGWGKHYHRMSHAM